jgi:hypothetical protein
MRRRYGFASACTQATPSLETATVRPRGEPCSPATRPRGWGQTLLSGVTAGLVAVRMPEGLGSLYRGRRVMRGIERPEEVWELSPPTTPD